MSDEIPPINHPPNRPEGSRRFAEDVLRGLIKRKTSRLTPEDKLMIKAKHVTTVMRQHLQPILKAGGGFDKDALRATICTLYLQSFDKFSKDELVSLCTILHTEIMLEDIDSNPSGNDKPDLLSGQ